MANVLQGNPIPASHLAEISSISHPPSSPSSIPPPSTPTSPPPASPLPEWGTDSVPLKEFSAKKVVPGFAKIVKGNYRNLGPPSKFSFGKQHCEVFIHSVKVGVKVLAHGLRRVESAPAVTKPSKRGVGGGGVSQSIHTRVYAVDQRLSIPISYQGWFELLSEDGKSARPITSVHELSKVSPDKVLVRENMKGYIQNEEGKMIFDSSKIILAGDQLLLCGELTIPTQAENKKVKLLRCFDSKGDQVFLSFDQKGMFTPIAGENDFTGVFTIRDVIRRFRLPLTVKLIQGVRPKVDPAKFTGLIRLDWVYSDETAFVCPIEKNHIRLLPIPVDTSLQMVSASNQNAMKSTELYNNMFLKCNRMISNYNNTVHLIVNLPDAIKGKSNPNSNIFSVPFETGTSRSKNPKAKVKEDKLMDEIDNLYGYVREGGAPPTIPKLQYDSDEESYFEEPAYEPLDDFRARLRAMEAGEKVTHHSKYKPEDVSKLVFHDPDKIDDENPYGVINGGGLKPPQRAPPLPPRPSFSRTPSTGSPANSTTTPPQQNPTSPPPATTDDKPNITQDNPPPVPPRKYSEPEKFVTTVSTTSGIISSHRTKQPPQEHPKSPGVTLYSASSPPQLPGGLNRKLSKGSHGSNHSNSGSSNGHRHAKLFARDFRDSDISSPTKASSGSSGGAKKSSARKKMQTLYL